jgi:cytochrome c oxidase cbb3-type subunit 3
MKRHPYIPGALILFAAFFFSCSEMLSAQEVPVSKDNVLKQENVIRGQKLFGQNCAACHGANATGGMGPNLTMSSLVRHDAGGVDVGKVIHEGRMDKGMPAFPQITDAQASDIAAFLHARIDAFTRASALGVSAFAGSLNVGDAAVGKTIFAAKCATCHSATGDLKGIATKRDGPELEAAMLMPKAKPDSGSVTAAGKKYEGLFLHRDAFIVTLKTADGMAHTWETDHVTVQPNDPLKGHRALLPTYTDKEIHDVFSYLETLK